MPIGIEHIEYYLPELSISSKELSNRFNFDLEFVEKKIGTHQIFISKHDEFTSDLAVAASQKIFSKRPDLKEKIDVIVLCTQTPDFQLPHTSALVQKKMGLKKDIACFDIGLGCSGFVYGLSIISSFMESNGFNYGLLITAETYSKIICDTDRNTKPIFSDGAAATLMSREPMYIPMKFSFGTNGYKYDSLIYSSKVNNSGIHGDSALYMDGRGIFELVATEVPKDIEKCLQINGLKFDDLDVFVFHQASKYMLETLTKILNIDDPRKVVKCTERFGNTVSSSIPMALTIIGINESQKNRNILISGFGVGLSWATTILNEKGK
ncbi:MAG: ketoacyl-ACP synthase III [Desulfobacula sp.]|jgi:3-oxoacyl-[acyl-carrier-protein] synthase-3